MGTIQATLLTSTLSGEVGKAITITTNDTRRPKIWLTLRATILASVSILPTEEIHLTNRPKEGSIGRLLIRREPGEVGTLVVGALTASNPAVELSARPLDEKRFSADGLPTGYVGDWLLEARLVGRPDELTELGEISFSTNLPRQPTVTVPLRLRYVPPVELSTRDVVVPASGRREPLLVSVLKDLDATTLEVEAIPEALNAVLEPSGSRFYKLHLDWPSGGATKGELVFRVDGEDYRVPVTREAP